jgi:dihydroorotate dehydrogenase
MYPLLRDLLFCVSPEKAHYFSMNCLQEACNFEILKQAIRKHFSYDNPSLERNVFGLHFKNPVGLGAGFDKNAAYLRELSTLGFGFVEVGTITPKAQLGNLKPRLFRLPKDQALINRMGFNNDGVETIKQRLLQWNNYKSKNGGSPIIVGGNIGKNKITPNETAYRDYEICFTELFDYVDYFVVNVSSPNTPGLRELQEKDSLRKILSQLQNINQGKTNPKPLLLKIAPDLTTTQLNDIVELCFEVQLSGLVATNTTIDRGQLQTPQVMLEKIGAGGLSGKPLTNKSTSVVQYLSQQTQQKIPIIASGGIFNGNDAIEKINAGASLVQVWTGFVYEGPGIAKNICKQIVG